MSRLAILSTHPIQYYAPLFRSLAERRRVDLHVFFGWQGATRPVVDPGFGREVEWDIPLLDGYGHTFVPNRSRDPGSHHFRGLDCPELVPRILQWRPDAVLVVGWAYRSHLAALRSLYGRVPVLFRGDSTLLDERPGLRRWTRRHLLTWVYRHVDVALYVGHRNREYFEAHGLTGSRLAWAPHAVENARFSGFGADLAARPQQWRQALGVPENAPTALFVGKLDWTKAPEVLLSAFQDVARPDWHLVIVGSGPLEEALRQQGTGDARIHFVGFQNQSRMPEAYRLGDLLVLPSRSESWGLAVNEAMASGLPVVVSDRVGCAPDLVHEGRNGFVVPAEDPRALGAALRRILADPTSRARMGAASRAIIQSWSIEAAAQAIETAVARVTGGAARRRAAVRQAQ